MERRKKEHINLAILSQASASTHDDRFNYEPLLNAHPKITPKPFPFLSKTMMYPIWISSMTGDTEYAKIINTNLAKVCHEFGLGMGLGSCRILLNSNEFIENFDLRDIIGPDYPFYANLGISQIEKAVLQKDVSNILNMVKRLRADGLIIHVNPIQEWLQPEGDHLSLSPLQSIKEFLNLTDLRIIVKEVGQGFGPASLLELMKLPLEAIEFGAFGGTNFAKVELQRSMPSVRQLLKPLSIVGNTAAQMTDDINYIIDHEKGTKCKQIIISGGIRSFLDAYYLMSKSKIPAIYGQAATFLKYAIDYEQLKEFVQFQIKGLEMATAYLRIKNDLQNE
jgi:isopentenyl-diphosphate delta-isomerase